MAITDKLSLVIDADGKGAIRELNAVGAAADKELGRAETRAEALGKTFTKTGTIMVGAAAVIGVGLFKAAQAASDAELQVVKLENALKNNPKTAGVSTKSFEELATAIQGKTAADADQIVSAEAMLATFRLTGDQIKEATPLVVDYARRFGVDLTSAATQVGKAFAGNAATLQRNGVIVDENAYKTDRYGAVIAALRENAGGFAEAEGETFNGSLERMKNQLGDVVEGIGSGVIPVFQAMVDPISNAAQAFSQLPEGAQSAAGSVLGVATALTAVAGTGALVVGKGMEIKNSFDQMSLGAQSNVKSLAGAGGLIGAVIAAGLVLHQVGEGIDNNVGPQETYNDAVKKMAGGFKDATSAGEAFDEQVKSSREELMSIGAGEFFDLGGPIPEFFGIVKQQIRDVVDEGGVARDEFKKLTETSVESSAQVIEAMKAKGEATDEYQKILDGAIEKEVTAIASDQRASAAINEKVQAELAATKGTEEYAAAQEEAAKATDELINATLASANSGLAYERQLDGLEDSTAAYSLAARDAAAAGGTNTVANEALSDASLALRSDLLGAAAAAAKQAEDQAKAEGRSLSAAESFAVQRGALEQLKQKYPELTPVIDTLINKLNEAGRDRRARLDIETADAEAKADRLRQKITDALSQLPGGRSALRASGGPVTAGNVYTVGERGPEMFVPNSSGRIISADRMGNYNSNNRTNSVTVNIAGGGVNPRAVADEILWKMKVA